MSPLARLDQYGEYVMQCLWIRISKVSRVSYKVRVSSSNPETLFTRYNRLSKPVEQSVGQPVECLFTRCSRLLNRLCNLFDNRLNRVNEV